MEEGEIQMDIQKDQLSPQHLAIPADKKIKKFVKPTKSRDLVTMLKANPIRLRHLRDSLKAFTLIKKNIYLDRKRKLPKNDELQSCLCVPESDETRINQHSNVSYNCIQRCLNRMISTECDDQTCRCNDLCENRKFQKHQYACIYPFPAGGKGWGLCAGQKIKKGQFIMQYTGQIFSINSQQGKKRVKQYSSSTCTYLMKTSKGQVIDPTYKGNLARFINHSCQPNCITQKWNVLGQICIGIFALKDLQQNQQLTFDYQFDVFNTPLTKCLCSAKKCKGYLGLRPTDISAEQWDQRLQGMICQICNKNYDDDDLKLIICDDCNLGFHTYCLNPPRQQIPQEAFYCQICLDQKQREKQKIEKQQKQILKQRKKKIMREQRIRLKNEEQEEDGLPTTQTYQRMFEFLKKQQSIATQLLFFQDEAIEQENIIIKKKQVVQQISTPEKPKINAMKVQTPRKKDEISNTYSKAVDKFQVYLNKHNKLLHQLNNFKIDKNIQIKKIIIMNKIQMHLVRSNFILFEKIGATIFWDHNAKNFNDIFLKNIELAVMGSENQISMFEQIIAITSQIVNELQTQMGITEATISIPAIFLKKFIGPGHYLINQMQKNFTVSIFYHRRFINDECYPIQIQTKLLIKGAKDNIIKAYQQIKRKISTFEIERIFLNPYEIKTILNNLSSLKRKPQMVEFRINRDPPFKDVNHPFYFIQQKNKQITLIGTRIEIERAKKQILSFFEEPNRKQQFNFNISLFLAPYSFKPHLLNIKQSLEKEVPNIKMMIFDPTPPRKNMTISFLGNRDNRQRAKEFLIKKLEYLNKEGKINQNFEVFQDQMNFQMSKYYFKYMQNALLTKDTAFMKGWDILNGYFFQEQQNYMWKSIKKSLLSDHETLLYAFFVLKDKIIKKIQKQSGHERQIDDEVFQLIKQNMIRIINIHQVNNTPSLKHFNSIFDKYESKKLFKDSYYYINFVKQQDTKEDKLIKEEIKSKMTIQQNHQEREVSRSRSRQKQKYTSLFERTILRKNKNLIAILEQEQKIRMKERAKKKL